MENSEIIEELNNMDIFKLVNYLEENHLVINCNDGKIVSIMEE